MKAWKAESSLLFITLIWGVTFSFTKIGLVDSSPLFYLFLRFSVALTVSFAFWGKYLLTIKKENFRKGLILGGLLIGGFICQTYGLKLTTVSKSAFITGMSVVFTPFAYTAIFRRKVQLWQKIGVAVAFVGLWLFSNPSWQHLNMGDVFTLISTFFWAFYITYMDILTKEIRKFEHTMQLVFMQFLVAIPVALISSLLFERSVFYFHISAGLIVSLVYNGIIASIFLTMIHTAVQKYTNPVKAALIFSLEPIFASIAALLIFNEILNGREYIGAAILFVGVIVSETGDGIWGWVKSRGK